MFFPGVPRTFGQDCMSVIYRITFLNCSPPMRRESEAIFAFWTPVGYSNFISVCYGGTRTVSGQTLLLGSVMLKEFCVSIKRTVTMEMKSWVMQQEMACFIYITQKPHRGICSIKYVCMFTWRKGDPTTRVNLFTVLPWEGHKAQ